MSGGFDRMAFSGGLLSSLNQQIDNNRNRQATQEDYAAKLAAQNTAEAQKQDMEDKRQANLLNQQTEEFARMLNNGNDPTPGHITAAHMYLKGTGADIAKMDSDTLEAVQNKLRVTAGTINAKLEGRVQNKVGISPVTGQPIDDQTVGGLGATPAVTAAGVTPDTRVSQTDLAGVPQAQKDAARTNVHQGANALQGMYPPLTSSNYNEDFIRELASYDPARAAMAKQAVLGTLPTGSARMLIDKNGKPTQLAKDALQYDPNLNLSDIARRQDLVKDYLVGKGPTSTSVRINAMNQLALHMKELADAGTALNNGAWQTGSAIVNSAQSAFNDPRRGNFDTIRSAAADEVSRLFRAGVISDKEKESWDENIKSSQSIKGLLGTPEHPGTLVTMSKLIRDSADTVNDKWNGTMNQNVDWMTPRSRQALEYVLNGGKQEGQDNTPAAAPNAAQPSGQQQSTPAQQGENQPSAPPQVHVTSQKDIDNAPVGATIVVNGKVMGVKKAPVQQQAPHPTQQPAATEAAPDSAGIRIPAQGT